MPTANVERKLRETLSSLLRGIHFTTIERKILYKLADGEKHTLEAVMLCLDDELAERHTVSVHIGNIREKIEHLSHTIICVAEGGRMYYRYVLLLDAILPDNS